MYKKIIIVIIAIIIIGAIGYSCTLSTYYPGPKEDLGEITYIDAPDYYSSSGSLNITIRIKNNYTDYIQFQWRILDRDFVGPVHPNYGWSSRVSIIGPGYEAVIKSISCIVPGYYGIGSDFHGKIQISHCIFANCTEKWIDDSEDFTIKYTSNSPPITGQISGPSTAETGDPVNFYCNVYDDDGDNIQTRWDLGDGTITDWVSTVSTSSIVYTYTDSGTYDVKVQPKDSFGNIGFWSNSKTITISGSLIKTVDIIIGVKDSSTNDYLSDVNITINSETKKTINGKTLFVLAIGSYEVQAIKEGYKDYSEIHTFSSNIEITIKLDSESFIPGFELITFLCAIGIIFIILKKRIRD